MGRLLSAYYGWRIVGALAITQLVSWGILYYAFSVVLLPMQLETGWDTGAITGAFSLGLVIGGLVALPIGRLLDRFGARQIMSLGSVASVLLVVAWSQVQTLTDLYVVWSLLGVSMACVLYEPAFAVIARWFQKRRSQALTAVTIGGGLASVVFVPLTNALVTAGGWRDALLALAVVLALITIPLHVLVLRRHPSDLGLQVDGGRVQIKEVNLPPPTGSLTLREALRTGAFWWLSLAFTGMSFGVLAISVHLIALLGERGVDAGFAALILSVLGGSQIPGRLVFAPLAARFTTLTLTRGMFTLTTAGLVLLLFAHEPLHLLAFAVLFGAGQGASSPARAALMAEYFGPLHYGTITGMQSFVTTFARSLSPVAVGVLVTATGSYALVTPVMLVLSVTALFALWMMPSNTTLR